VAPPAFPTVPTTPVPLPKLARVVKDLPVNEWVPLRHALAQIRALVGSGELAARDLTQRARSGAVTLAARRIHTSGTEQLLVLKRSFWGLTTITPSGRVQGKPLLLGRWYVFVRLRELDKFYPVAAAPSEHQADVASRRRPGRQPKLNWPQHVARELIRRARAGKSTPTAPEMLDFCEQSLGWQPDIRAMQRLLRELLS
jgi:hypothetical protein